MPLQKSAGPTAVGSNATVPPAGKSAEKQEPDIKKNPEPETFAAGPDVGFTITNIGKQAFAVYHVSTGHDGIPVHSKGPVLQPGQSLDSHSLFGLIRLKLE